MVVEIFNSACLNRAMTTNSLVGDFKSHGDQRMIADTETTPAFDIRDFKIHYGELLLRQLRP